MDRVSAALVVVTSFPGVVPGLCVEWDVTFLLLVGCLELSVVIATVVCCSTGIEPRDDLWEVVIPLVFAPTAITMVEHRQATKHNLINANIFLK